MVQFKGVVERKGVHVHRHGVEPGVRQHAHLGLDQLALGRHQEHAHLGVRAVRVENLEVEFHRFHIEGHVLLGLPAHQLAGLGLLHAFDLDLLDDHVAATDRSHHVLAGDAGLLQAGGDRIGHDPGVHNFAFDDGVRQKRRDRHPNQLGLRLAVIDHRDLDQAGSDVESDGCLLATEKRHREVRGRRAGREGSGRQSCWRTRSGSMRWAGWYLHRYTNLASRR